MTVLTNEQADKLNRFITSILMVRHRLERIYEIRSDEAYKMGGTFHRRIIEKEASVSKDFSYELGLALTNLFGIPPDHVGLDERRNYLAEISDVKPNNR